MGEILNLEDEMRDMELGIEEYKIIKYFSPHRWD
jgi:hypothetical protein